MSHPILLVHSNPADTERLRLDREHRALDQMIRTSQLEGAIRILSAATVADLISAIHDQSIRIVHFSGHGNSTGLYFESSADSDYGSELSAEQLRELLIANAPHIHALVLASCYSADSINYLVAAAPYVITVDGPADDGAAIAFTQSL